MRRAISLAVLLVILFLIGQFGLNFIKKGHEVHYDVTYGDITFKLDEKYNYKQGNYYDVTIKNGEEVFYYTFDNSFNKQKKIINEVVYYSEDGKSCIYPILVGNKGTYIECLKDDKRYTSTSMDKSIIAKINSLIEEKGYPIPKKNDISETETLSNSTIYKNNLLPTDIITLWDYKGVQVIKNNLMEAKHTSSFDKYENQHGYLVGKYYIIPEYFSSRVQEFSSVNVINLENLDSKSVSLGYTLSSSTYINGVVDNKLYYTDPSNLLQIEVNPTKKSARLIGSKDIGGQNYQNGWKDDNIYNFVNEHILFQGGIPQEVIDRYSYVSMVESNSSYYYYNKNFEVYKVPKEHIEESILLFKMDNINNFKVVGHTIYFVVHDTLYYFQEDVGIVPILKNNELRYNIFNRIDIYRKS